MFSSFTFKAGDYLLSQELSHHVRTVVVGDIYCKVINFRPRKISVLKAEN